MAALAGRYAPSFLNHLKSDIEIASRLFVFRRQRPFAWNMLLEVKECELSLLELIWMQTN
jgi:hypothetical protein